MRRALRVLASSLHLLPPLLLVAFVWILVARGCRSDGTDPSASARLVVPRGDLAADEAATIALFERASPAVVHVANLVVVRDARTRNPLEIPRGAGTGFLWDEDGHVVTNFHVVEGGDDFVVTLSDRTQRRARVVGTAASYDLAVLFMEGDAPQAVPLPVGSSADLRVGQHVFAIGNPFGLDQTLTHGLVSGLGREVEAPNGRPIYDVIQTDAAINPGNSGGPLLDSAGRLIGVNSQIASPSGGSAGIGFAIPVDTVNRVVPELIRTGGVYRRPVLGVLLAPDGDPRTGGAEGALVDDVFRGSGADRAGVRPGDVVVRVGEQPIRNRTDLYRALDRLEVGGRARVTVRRGDAETPLVVELAGTER